MSAFMCSDRHLTVLAIYAVRHDLDLVGRSDESLLGREMRVFRALKRENLASLDARYPGDTHDDEPSELWALDEKARPLAHHLSKVAIIKACHCYAYQACEHTGWKDSAAKRYTSAIESHAVHNMPGYDDAPWGL